ncbi:hypothetical protein IL306_001084, partial [Fusarium sp. DS 682]
KDDVVSFQVGQRQGAVVGRGDLANVGLKDPERLLVVLSCLRVSIPGHSLRPSWALMKVGLVRA